MTARIIRAMQNPYLNILFHPTGRIIGRREGYEIDIDAVIAAAKKYGVALEIDAYPNRMDLLDQVDGIEQITFARSRGPTPDIDSGRRSVFGDDYSATRAGIQIVRMPDSDVIYACEGYLPHAAPPFLTGVRTNHDLYPWM